ncbi:hypothetical protein ACAG25_13550 [Mycobacterium sp. pV006]|uniref:hypothetical protein n=1 Tax=Mycobacterium sp. pV006 TaxID=3238983 RepID=UPI00351AB842
MGVVLGLSLTSDEVVWVLVDESERAALDHDVRSARDGADDVVAAARSAACLAAAAGVQITAVRVTGATGDVVTALRSARFEDAEAVPQAVAAREAGPFAPRLQAAAGAALCASGRDVAATEVPHPARRRRGLLATLAGTAAAAVLSVLFLTTGSVPQDARAATTGPAPTTVSGWVSVPAPHVSTVTRKVVTPSIPARRVTAYTPAPVHTPPVAAEQHLGGTSTALAGPSPTVPDGDLPSMSAPVMTDLSNLFTALP